MFLPGIVLYRIRFIPPMALDTATPRVGMFTMASTRRRTSSASARISTTIWRSRAGGGQVTTTAAAAASGGGGAVLIPEAVPVPLFPFHPFTWLLPLWHLRLTVVIILLARRTDVLWPVAYTRQSFPFISLL